MPCRNTMVAPHALCRRCTSFWGAATCLQGGPSTPQHMLHSPRRSDVLTAASRGCHFCSIIVGSVAGCTGNHDGRRFHDGADGPVYVSLAELDPGQGSFLATLFPCEQTAVTSHDQILNTCPIQLRPVQSCTQQHLDSSRLQTTTFSDATAKLINAWISECQATHAFCGDDPLAMSDRPRAQPRRLLDLQAFEDADRIRLIDATGSNGSCLSYCALSYSWGFSKPYTMTSSNVAELQDGIPVRDLPKLLRDAVQIARGIGFRYLWIDALCIMQDGRRSSIASDDWADQAGKMNDIFGNAIVTIAASECFDGTQSIIVPRNPLGHITCNLDLAGTGLGYDVVPSCTPYCMLHTFDKAQYHLDSRAWVFQERILSPRTLHFTRNFIHLECRTELRCEGALDAAECHHSGAIAKAEYQVLFPFCGPSVLDDGWARDGFLAFWHELIRRYSTTNLSRPSDLLVAVAGLVRQVQRRSLLTWSFGLWREWILYEMLWYVRGGDGVGTSCRERAPTWSWASIEVRGPQIMYEPASKVSLLAEATALPEPSEPATGRPGADVVDQMIHAVRVTGRLKPGAPDSASDDLRIHKNCQGMPPGVHPQCPFHPDYDLPGNMELYSLLVAHVSGTERRAVGNAPHSWLTQVGLVLTPVAGRLGQFQRVGYFHHDMQRETPGYSHLLPSLFENIDTTEVEII